MLTPSIGSCTTPLTTFGRRDAEDLVDGRRDVVDMMELRRAACVGLDPLGPRDRPSDCAFRRNARRRAWCAGTACRRPRPSRRDTCCRSSATAEGIEAAHPVQRRDLLLDGVGDLVLRQQLADRAVLALGARAVVAEDVENRACCRACPRARVRRSPCRPGRRHARRTRRRLPSAAAGTAARSRGCCPRRPCVAGARRQLGVGGNPAELLLAREDSLAHARPSRRRTCLCTCRPTP